MLSGFVIIMHQDVNSNSRGSLLTKMEVESDSDVPEFSLPPKSIVKRPKKTIRKRFYICSQLFNHNLDEYTLLVLLNNIYV